MSNTHTALLEALKSLVRLHMRNDFAAPIDEANGRDTSKQEMDAWEAARAAIAQAEAAPVAPLSDGFEQWWAIHRVKRALNPAGVARIVWEAAARHNRAATPQTPATQRPAP